MVGGIRLATPDDARAMLDIYAPFVEDTVVSFEYVTPTLSQFASRVEGTLERLPWLLHSIDGTVSGYAYASPHKARPAYQWTVDLSVYVDPHYHRQGIASALYDRLIAILKLQGYYGAIAGIGLPNLRSQAFHAAYGFTPVGVYHNVGYKLGAWRDVARYELTIATRPDAPVPPMDLPSVIGTDPFKMIMEEGQA